MSAPLEVRLELAFVELLEAIADPASVAGTPLAALIVPFASVGTSPLAGVTIEEGHRSDVQNQAERLIVDCGPPTGAFVQNGIYQIRAAIVVLTHGKPVAGEAQEPIVRHGQRLEKIAAVLQARAAVIAALTEIDPGIKVASYYPAEPLSARQGQCFIAERPFLCTVTWTGV
jgi:hypothetical protein